MKLHLLKINLMFLYAVMDGNKNFEFRQDDRDYEVGDIVRFCDPDTGIVFQDVSPYIITYVLRRAAFEHVPLGWCIFSIKKLVVE